MKDIKIQEQIESCGEYGVATWVTILTGASIGLDGFTEHKGPRLMVSHLCNVHHKHGEGEEQYIVEGTSSGLLQVDPYEKGEVSGPSSPI